MDNNILTYAEFNCKFSIVLVPKYKVQKFYGRYKKDIGNILRNLCNKKGIDIFEAIACEDYIYMVVGIPPKFGILDIIKYLKQKSSNKIFDQNLNLKIKYEDRQFWCVGYYANTERFDGNMVNAYVREQIRTDLLN